MRITPPESSARPVGIVLDRPKPKAPDRRKDVLVQALVSDAFDKSARDAVLRRWAVEAAGPWRCLGEESLPAEPEEGSEEVRGLMVYGVVESLRGKIPEPTWRKLLDKIVDVKCGKQPRLAALHALGLMGEAMPVEEMAALQERFDDCDIYSPEIHAALIGVLVEKGGERGRASVNRMFDEYLRRINDSTEGEAPSPPNRKRTNPIVLTAFISTTNSIDSVVAVWLTCKIHNFALWDDEIKNRNLYQHFIAIAEAIGRLRGQVDETNYRYVIQTLDEMKRLPLSVGSSRVHEKVMEALGILGGELAWESIMRGFVGFPFGGSLAARVRYISDLVGDRIPDENPLTTCKVNSFVLAATAKALGCYPREESVKIIEAIRYWVLRYLMPVRDQAGPRTTGARNLKSSYVAASRVEQKIIEALANIVRLASVSGGESRNIIDSALTNLTELIDKVVNANKGLTCSSEENRKAYQLALDACVEAILALIKIGQLQGNYANLAFSGIVTNYNSMKDILCAVYRGMVFSDPDRFIAQAIERLSLPGSKNEEKVAVAYAIGERLRYLAEAGIIDASWNTGFVEQSRQLLYQLLEDPSNDNSVHIEAVKSLRPFADEELEDSLIEFLTRPQLNKPYDLKLTEEILISLAEFGGEKTLDLLGKMLEGKRKPMGELVVHVAAEKGRAVNGENLRALALKYLTLYGRRRNAMPFKLKPYLPDSPQEEAA